MAIKCISKNCPFTDVNPDDCHFIDGCDFAVEQPTNADRIRAMSDEELACYLALVENRKNGGTVFEDTSDKWLKWLKQPAEEE